MQGARLTAIIRIGMEQLSENLRIRRGIYAPQVPNFVAQGVGDEIILLTLQILIQRITRRLCITIITAFQILRRQ